MVCHWSNTSFW